MAEEKFDTLKMVGRQVPDHSVETDDQGHKYSVELPGHYQVGFLLRGVFRPIHSFPAAGLLADIKRASESAPSE